MRKEYGTIKFESQFVKAEMSLHFKYLAKDPGPARAVVHMSVGMSHFDMTPEAARELALQLNRASDEAEGYQTTKEGYAALNHKKEI